jgi:group I intron endonuclease
MIKKEKIAAIYIIRNNVNNKIYVGSTNDLNRRLRNHKFLLEAGKHHSKHLQNAYNKYGKENFLFEVYKKVNENELLIEEQKVLDYLRPFGKNGYNIAEIAGSPMKGKTHTDKVKAILREKLSGNKHPHFGKEVSEKWRRNISKMKKKFSDEEERSFLERYEIGESKTSIAKSVGVHITTITRAINRVKRFDY